MEKNECECCYLLVDNIVKYRCHHLICESCHLLMTEKSDKYTCIYCNPLNLEYKNKLAHDDKYIKERIGNIPKNWNLKFFHKNNNDLEIIFSKNSKQIFKDYENITKKKLKKFMEKITIRVKYLIKDDDYNKSCQEYSNNEYCSTLYKGPLLPPSWKSCYYTLKAKPKLKSQYGLILFRGIKVQEERVIKIIENFYKNFKYKIKSLNHVIIH